MTRTRNHRHRATKNKQYKKQHSTKRRLKDIDQIQDDLIKEVEQGEDVKQPPFDDDLPGMGQFYCTPCARHFIDQLSISKHQASKIHKRRLKDVAQQQYSQTEADLAAGKTVEVLPPAHGHPLRSGSSLIMEVM